jgi:DNA-binding NarL/FixJ family response regulator
MKVSAYRIVLADDHVIVRQGIRRMIEEVPGLMVVGEASDGPRDSQKGQVIFAPGL